MILEKEKMKKKNQQINPNFCDNSCYEFQLWKEFRNSSLKSSESYLKKYFPYYKKENNENFCVFNIFISPCIAFLL